MNIPLALLLRLRRDVVEQVHAVLRLVGSAVERSTPFQAVVGPRDTPAQRHRRGLCLTTNVCFLVSVPSTLLTFQAVTTFSLRDIFEAMVAPTSFHVTVSTKPWAWRALESNTHPAVPSSYVRDDDKGTYILDTSTVPAHASISFYLRKGVGSSHHVPVGIYCRNGPTKTQNRMGCNLPHE